MLREGVVAGVDSFLSDRQKQSCLSVHTYTNYSKLMVSSMLTFLTPHEVTGDIKTGYQMFSYILKNVGFSISCSVLFRFV